MASLISLRAEIMRGDYRALYLGWLASIQGRVGYDGTLDDSEEESSLEPPVPAGLRKLSAAQQSLANFCRIEDELIEAAAAASGGEPPNEPSQDALVQWIKRLPASEKEAYLIRFVTDEHADYLLRAEVSLRFREATAPKSAAMPSNAGHRTVAELLAGHDVLVKERDRKAAEQATAEKARKARERAAKRTKELDDLSRREPAAWLEVDRLICTKTPKNYDLAVTLISDLRQLAERSGRLSEADARIRALREQHRSKPTFIKRLEGELGKLTN
jgi:hypothetical protein